MLEKIFQKSMLGFRAGPQSGGGVSVLGDAQNLTPQALNNLFEHDSNHCTTDHWRHIATSVCLWFCGNTLQIKR